MNRRKKSNINTSGFTLVELLITMAVLGMLFGAGFYFTSIFFRTESIVHKTLGANQCVRFVMGKIASEIREAKTLSPASSPSLLILDYDGFTIRYDYANKKVRRRKGGGSSYLTETGDVSGLIFGYPSTKLVHIRIILENSSFESMAAVRN